MTRTTLLAAAVLAAGALPAAAQFGDAALSYKDGVVYDDDLVPGRTVNQPFEVEGPADAFTPGGVPRSSPDLIANPGLRAAEERRIFGDIQSEALQSTVTGRR